MSLEFLFDFKTVTHVFHMAMKQHGKISSGVKPTKLIHPAFQNVNGGYPTSGLFLVP
jgi:hypothetical protein